EMCTNHLRGQQQFGKIPNTVLMLSVPQLPKNALMEVQSLALSKQGIRNLSKLCEHTIEHSKRIPQTNFTGTNVETSQNNNKTENSGKKEIKLKYAHLKKKRKKKWRDLDPNNVILANDQVTDLGGSLTIINRGIFSLNLGDTRFDHVASNDKEFTDICTSKIVSYSSLCELKTNECNLNVLYEILKAAVFNSVLGLNGYGYWLDKTGSNWMEEFIVYIRLYYVAEILDPHRLLKCVEDCIHEQRCGTTNGTVQSFPNISMIPVKSVHFLQSDKSTKHGLFLLFPSFLLACLFLKSRKLIRVLQNINVTRKLTNVKNTNVVREKKIKVENISIT
ncbi:hypothetical protein RFI_16648, partial [Reticulomyxa filosa]